MGPLPLAATGRHFNFVALGVLGVWVCLFAGAALSGGVCVRVFASAAFSGGVRGRISSGGGVTVGEVAVGGIGACVVIVQADSAMVAERRLMARQMSPTRSASKFMRTCRSTQFYLSKRSLRPSVKANNHIPPAAMA